MPKELLWSMEDQQFITLPDGDVATHKQIKEYYETYLQQPPYKCEKTYITNKLEEVIL